MSPKITIYVDKTSFIRQLTDEGTHEVLSRPRRFGKSPSTPRRAQFCGDPSHPASASGFDIALKNLGVFA